MSPRLRRRLARLARRQHGVVTREQLLALGITPRTIDWALDTAQLTVLFPGVYRINGTPDTWRGRALAAQLRVDRQLRRLASVDDSPPLAVVGGAAACHLHELPGFRRAPKVTIVTSQRCRSSAVPITRRTGLTNADVTTIERIPVTSLAWTVVESAAAGTASRRADLLAHVLGTGLLRPGQLLGPAYRTIELVGRPAVIRHLGELTGPVDHTRSRTEAAVADGCVAAGLPAPGRNRSVTTGGGATYELDLAWMDARVDVEVDGPHHLLPSQRRRDRARDRDLRGGGWDVVRVPVEEVDDDLEGVVARIRTALDRQVERGSRTA